MKKLFAIAVVAAALAALLATSAFAAAPTTPTTPVPSTQAGSGFGYGAGRGIHAPGTGLAQGAVQNARRGAPEWAGDNDTAAKVLGLTVEQLQAERQSGKSLVQIAATKGISEDELIAKLGEARKAMVAKLLADGKISQAQADYMTSNSAEHLKVMVERTNVGRPAFAGQSSMAGTGRGRWNR